MKNWQGFLDPKSLRNIICSTTDRFEHPVTEWSKLAHTSGGHHPAPCPRRVTSSQLARNMSRQVFLNLLGRRLHNLSGKLVAEFSHPHSKKVLPYVYGAFCADTEKSRLGLCAPPLQVFTYICKMSHKPSLHEAKRFQFCQPSLYVRCSSPVVIIVTFHWTS